MKQRWISDETMSQAIHDFLHRATDLFTQIKFSAMKKVKHDSSMNKRKKTTHVYVIL